MQEILLQQAVLGTDRSPNTTEYFREPNELFAELNRLLLENEATKAHKLLLAGGVHALLDLSGQIPGKVSSKKLQEALAPGLKEEPSEKSKKINIPLSKILLQIVDHFFDIPIIPLYYMKKMADSGFTLPPRFLPKLFDILSKRKAYKRKDILDPLLGPCGCRLAGLNPAWQWYGTEDQETENTVTADSVSTAADTTSSTTDIWENGTFPQRLEFLTQKRRNSPDEARELLMEVWKGEKADRREQFLAVLEDNPGSADLPFLEKAISDRSSSVRSVAMTLCASLPESTFYKTVTEYASSLLTSSPSPVILLPEVYTAEMKKFGIVEKAPQHIGVHGWWFAQWLELVPLVYWEEYFQKKPEEILCMFSKDDNFNSLIIALSRSAIRFKGPDAWLFPLWDAWMSDNKYDRNFIFDEIKQNLLSLCLLRFPVNFYQKFNKCKQLENYGSRISQAFVKLAESRPLPWPDSLASVFCDYLQQLKSDDYMLHYAVLLPPPLMFAVRKSIEKKIFSPSGFVTESIILQKMECCEQFNRKLTQLTAPMKPMKE